MTEPCACLASFPVSRRRVFWPTCSSRVCISLSMMAGLRPALLPDVQTLDQVGIPLRVFVFEVVEQPTALADQHQQPAARVMILRVRLEVLGQVIDALGENGDLNFWGTGVGVV